MVEGRAQSGGQTRETAAEAADGQSDRSSRLTRKDWIDAAWKALAQGSIDTVKVDRLA